MKISVVRILGISSIYCIYVEQEKHSSVRFYALGYCSSCTGIIACQWQGTSRSPGECRFKHILYTIPSYYKVCLTGVGSVKRQWTSNNETLQVSGGEHAYLHRQHKQIMRKPTQPLNEQEARWKTKNTPTISINYSNHRLCTVQISQFTVVWFLCPNGQQ